MTTHKLPKDVETIYEQLPEHVSVDIQHQTIFFIKHESAKLARPGNRRERKRYVKGVMKEFFRLVREAGVKYKEQS